MIYEHNLIENALNAFYKNTGIRINVVQYEPLIEKNRRADAIVQLDYQGVKKEYLVEAKKWLTTQAMGNVVNQINTYPKKGLIITDYVNPNIAEKLKEMNIPFIDTVGNAYINEPPILIYIRWNRPEERKGKKQTTRAFQQTGLKVLFAFLCKKNLVNAPYREIQKITNVALGTVGWVIYDLKKEGYIIQVGNREKKLYQKEKLFNRWVEAYNENLKPKINLGAFKTNDANFWIDLDIKKYNALWGGETAAYYLTKYLKPEVATIYIKNENEKENLMKLLIEHRLKEDKYGNVKIYDVFWGNNLIENFNGYVHPIITYADLIETGDPRNIETARLIYENEIDRLIRED